MGQIESLKQFRFFCIGEDIKKVCASPVSEGADAASAVSEIALSQMQNFAKN
jgi:hypothetical protein